MLLDCPTCARSYTVTPAELGASGRTVMCPSCQTQWHVSNADAMPSASNDDARKTPKSRTMKTASQLAAGASYRHTKIFRRMGLGLAVVAGVLLAVPIITQRAWIVRHSPRTAAIYARLGLGVNVRGLTFAKLEPLRLASSDVTVGGTIRNVAGRKVAVPRVAYEVQDAAGSPLLSWSEALTVKTLGAGKTLAFESSPHHMPADSRTVTVRFVSDDAVWALRKTASRTER